MHMLMPTSQDYHRGGLRHGREYTPLHVSRMKAPFVGTLECDGRKVSDSQRSKRRPEYDRDAPRPNLLRRFHRHSTLQFVFGLEAGTAAGQYSIEGKVPAGGWYEYAQECGVLGL